MARSAASAAAQLPDEHVGETQAAALAQLHGELVVGHVLVHVTLIAAEHRIAHAGAAHALEHHLGEQTLELLRDRAQRRRIVGFGATAQRCELLEVVGIDARRLGTCSCRACRECC